MFKKGDKVERINCDWGSVKVGDVYIVENAGVSWIDIEGSALKGCSAVNFILYENKGEELKKEVDFDDIQESVCTFCRGYYEMSPSYLCEGVKCDDAVDTYLEDNNLTIKQLNNRTI